MKLRRFGHWGSLLAEHAVGLGSLEEAAALDDMLELEPEAPSCLTAQLKQKLEGELVGSAIPRRDRLPQEVERVLTWPDDASVR